MKNNLLVRVSIFLGSCVGTVLLFEGAIRVVSLRKNIYTIEMVRYATKLKMADPLGAVSHVHRPSSRARLMGVDVRLNALGQRGEDFPAKKARGEKRLYFLGSSITMGWGVAENKIFSSRLESLLNASGTFAPARFRSINAGIGNYNSHFQYELFSRQVDVVSPDLVVLHYFINDAEPDPKDSNPLARYSFLSAYLNSELQGLYFRLFGGKDLAAYYDSLYQPGKKQWRETLNYITTMHAKSAARGAKFLVMLVPDTHNLRADSPYAPIYERIESAFRSRGLATLNAFPDFRDRFAGREAELWVQHDDPHPNAEGHALMADLLHRYFEQNNPLRLPRQSRHAKL